MLKYSLILIFLTYPVAQQVEEHRTRVCTVCKCVENKTVDCKHLELSSMFEPEAWADISGPNSTYTQIDLSYNRIGHVTQFPELNITKLSLRSNRIVKIDDLAFRNLTKLQYLDLGANELDSKHLGPNVFQGRFSYDYYTPLLIRHLDLSDNQIHTLNSFLFVHTPHVRELILKNNPLRVLDLGSVIALSSLQELEYLDLSNTQLTELPNAFLHSLKNLTELKLTGNLLTRVPVDVLAESHNLRTLTLDNNPIKVISSERPFPSLPSLKVLEMSYMPELTRIEQSSLKGLTGLSCFHCKENSKLEYISPFAFAANENDTSRPNITTLELNDNALRYLSRSFLRMDKMAFINVKGNNWSCDCDNQWMVSELVPTLLRTHSPVNDLLCSEPAPMRGKHFLTMYKMKYEMRCLDYYGSDPSHDSIILITVFSIIIGLMAIGLIVVWKVRIGSCSGGGTPNYSRAFYRPARSEERY